MLQSCNVQKIGSSLFDHIRMLLKRNTFTAANSKKRRKIACATVKALHISFLYIVASSVLFCFYNFLACHIDLLRSWVKKLSSTRPCVLLFHTVKALSEFLKDDWITCNALELWTLLAFPLVPDSAVAHRSFRCWDRTDAVPKNNAYNDLLRQASTDSDLSPSDHLIRLWLLVEESAAATSTLESKS